MLDFTMRFSTLAGIPFFELLLEPCEIALTPAGVCHDVISVVRVFSDDSVVNNATLFVQQDGKSRRIMWQR